MEVFVSILLEEMLSVSRIKGGSDVASGNEELGFEEKEAV